MLGGFSRGARLAARAVDALGCRALLALGYPFHTRGAPNDRAGLQPLLAVRAPTLIVQGERDAHGSRSALSSLPPLPHHVALHWVADANHRFLPRDRRTQASLWDDAAAAILAFAASLGPARA